MTAIRHSLFVLGATLLAALPLGASSVIPVDFARLSQLAHRVIGGRITEVTASRDGNDGYIYSNVKVLVSRSNPGEWVGREYTFRMIGGELDGKRVSIQGVPQLAAGDDVILFLNSQSDSVMGPTVGLWQGIYFVATNPYTSQDVVLNHSRKAIALTTKGAVATPSLGLEDAADADAFFERVRSYRSQ